MAAPLLGKLGQAEEKGLLVGSKTLLKVFQIPIDFLK